MEARGACGTDSASAAPATFLFSRGIVDVHQEQTLQVALLDPAAGGSSVTPVSLRLPGGEPKPLWSMAWRKEGECFVSDCLSRCPAAACPLPRSCASQGWALGPQGCRSVPQPEAPAVSSRPPAFAGTVPWQAVGGGTDWCSSTQMWSGFVEQMLPGTGWQNFGEVLHKGDLP